MWAEGGCKANSEPGYLDCNLYPLSSHQPGWHPPLGACYQAHHFNWRISSDTCRAGGDHWAEGRGWSQVCAVSHHQHCSPSLWLQLLIERGSMGERRKRTQRCCWNVHTQIRTSEANLCTFNFLAFIMQWSDFYLFLKNLIRLKR